MPQAIFWDNDGVLVDTEHLYFEATQRVLASVDIPLTEDDYRELFLQQGRGAWHLAEARGLSAPEVQALKRQRNALYAELIATGPRVLPGVLEVVSALHGRYRMGIVTSSRRDHFEIIHRDTGLLEYVDFVITADDCPRTKPCPDPYLSAIDASGCDRGACLAVEDSARGLEAATAAGLRCVIVPSRLTCSQAFDGALRRLDSVRELPSFLRTLSS
jgi:HAD superfamily hydrolase (TIGR01509 family)